MTFYGKIFQGPLGVRTKHFAAHSTSCDNFSTPTLGEHNLHNSIGTNLKILQMPHQWRIFFGKKYFDAHSGFLNFF